MQISLGIGLRTRMRKRRAATHGLPVSDAVTEIRTLSELMSRPTVPLAARTVQRDDALTIAFVIPAFFKGSGGHMTIANVIRGLERRGHRASIWIDDPGRRQSDPATAASAFKEWFGPFDAEVHFGLDQWRGADVAVATAWQTVTRVRLLSDTGARAYFIQDHEIEFFSTSYERAWAEDSYRHGFYPITAGRWLADVMKSEYGEQVSTPFELGIDTGLYHPQPGVSRLEDVVVFYGRAWTPRRAVPMALAALSELKRRRPRTELWAFGQSGYQPVDVPVKNLGVVEAADLPRLYSTATVGLALSMTNYSLVAQEMLACDLPCVELASPSSVAAFGHTGAVELAPLDPGKIAGALERLLDDPGLRAESVEMGRALVAERTWDAAAANVESGLREALARKTGG